jgi:hypothetical protein
MRDEFDDYYAAAEGGRPAWHRRAWQRVSMWLGATLAILVVGGVALWGYRLGYRDANAVPVIRASLEPAKVQPEEPGGAKIPHQDITSYSAGTRESPPDKITFAPPTERPAEEDVAMGALPKPAPKPEGRPDASAPQADGTAEASGPETAAVVGTEAPPDGLDATDKAPETSPLVRRRPGDLSRRVAVARRAASEEAELTSRAAASSVQIQLGAFPERDATKAEWMRIYHANEDILRGRALVVQSTISGGRRFFRLRAGPFRDRTEAQNICRALQARGHDCLVAVNG